MSELRADTITASDGTSPVTLTKQSAAKGWTNFNMVTPVINDSYNTSSITDVTTGQFHVLHANNMSNATYAPIGVSNNFGTTSNFGGASDVGIGVTAGSLTLGIATTGYGFATYDSAYVDAAQNQSVVHGDLA